MRNVRSAPVMLALVLAFAAAAGLTGQADATPAARPLLEFASWQRGAAENDLLYRLSVAPLPDRQTARWALARHYLGQGNAADALGVLGAMMHEQPGLEASAQFRAMRGYAQLRLGHIADAANDLEQIPLDGEAQIWLLRVPVREAQAKHAEAVAAFRRGAGALVLLPLADRLAVEISALRSAVAIQDKALATRLISELAKAKLAPAQLAELTLLRSKAAAMSGQAEMAAYYLKQAEKSAIRKVSTEARLIAVQQALRARSIAPAQAIQQLDKLRFSWRGDQVEFDLLSTLSALHLQSGHYRPALSTMREAVTYFPASDRTRALSSKMQNLFADLFARGGADKMPPLEALSLFSDFRELVPLGDSGDRMIRQLSDRLIGVGLPDRAAGLLEHQVRYRLTGTPQAVVAIRASLVELKANQPKQALALIRLTKQNDMPDAVRQTRDLVEARALIQLGQAASALDLIEDNSGKTADHLRMDAYWRTKNWSKLHRVAASLYADPVFRLQSADQRQLLRWAFALAMDGTAVERDVLHRRFGSMMAASPYAEAFALLTSARQIGTADTKRLAVALADIDQLQDLSRLYDASATKPAAPGPQAALQQATRLAAN